MKDYQAISENIPLLYLNALSWQRTVIEIHVGVIALETNLNHTKLNMEINHSLKDVHIDICSEVRSHWCKRTVRYQSASVPTIRHAT